MKLRLKPINEFKEEYQPRFIDERPDDEYLEVGQGTKYKALPYNILVNKAELNYDEVKDSLKSLGAVIAWETTSSTDGNIVLNTWFPDSDAYKKFKQLNHTGVMSSLNEATSTEPLDLKYGKGKKVKYEFKGELDSPYIKVLTYGSSKTVPIETYWIVDTDLDKWKEKLNKIGLEVLS